VFRKKIKIKQCFSLINRKLEGGMELTTGSKWGLLIQQVCLMEVRCQTAAILPIHPQTNRERPESTLASASKANVYIQHFANALQP